MNIELSRKEINVLRNALYLAISHCKEQVGYGEAAKLYENMYKKLVDEIKRSENIKKDA